MYHRHYLLWLTSLLIPIQVLVATYALNRDSTFGRDLTLGDLAFHQQVVDLFTDAPKARDIPVHILQYSYGNRTDWFVVLESKLLVKSDRRIAPVLQAQEECFSTVDMRHPAYAFFRLQDIDIGRINLGHRSGGMYVFAYGQKTIIYYPLKDILRHNRHYRIPATPEPFWVTMAHGQRMKDMAICRIIWDDAKGHYELVAVQRLQLRDEQYVQEFEFVLHDMTYQRLRLGSEEFILSEELLLDHWRILSQIGWCMCSTNPFLISGVSRKEQRNGFRTDLPHEALVVYFPTQKDHPANRIFGSLLIPETPHFSGDR